MSAAIGKCFLSSSLSCRAADVAERGISFLCLLSMLDQYVSSAMKHSVRRTQFFWAVARFARNGSVTRGRPARWCRPKAAPICGLGPDDCDWQDLRWCRLSARLVPGPLS